MEEGLFESSSNDEMYDHKVSFQINEPLLDRTDPSISTDTDTTRCSSASIQSRRILDRDGRFQQSRGRWSIYNTISRRIPPRARRCWDDWFHSLAYTRTVSLCAYLLFWYTLTIIFWACLYLSVAKLGEIGSDDKTSSKFCGMDIKNFLEALYFSLSTMTTIGYGVADYYFGDCWAPFLLVLSQVFNAIIFDAVAIGLLFQRMSRGQKRGRTIIFSDKAVVRRVRGQNYFMFRVGELRKRHIIEARVRAYCIRHERYPVTFESGTTAEITKQEENNSMNFQLTSPSPDLTPTLPIDTLHFVTRSARLVNPDEGQGGYLLMSLPHVVVHRMDKFSPLVPPKPEWYDAEGKKYSSIAMDEVGDQNFGMPTKTDQYVQEQDEILHFLKDREAEMIILLEGTDEITGTAVQARHSYRWDDIMFDYTFAKCVFPSADHDMGQVRERGGRYRESGLKKRFTKLYKKESDGMCEETKTLTTHLSKTSCVIDFSKFHDVLPSPPDCEWCTYVPDYVHE